jgi:nitroreductase
MENILTETTILDDLKWRYACKRFDSSRKLNSEQVDQVVESLNLTASSLGMQLMKCVVVENQELKNQLVASSYGQQQVADCSHLLVLCRYAHVDQTVVDEYVSRSSSTRNIPLDSPKIQGFKKMIEGTLNMSEVNQINWMNNQVYIALGNLLTVCANLRIDSCPMEGFVPEEIDYTLNLESLGLKSVLLCPIGFRHPEDPYAQFPKVRRPIDDFVVNL